jgi:hypothetical protein
MPCTVADWSWTSVIRRVNGPSPGPGADACQWLSPVRRSGRHVPPGRASSTPRSGLPWSSTWSCRNQADDPAFTRTEIGGTSAGSRASR